MTTAIRRILVPFDFSDCSSAALEHAEFLARTFGATIELVHVLEPLPGRLAGAPAPQLPAESLGEHAWRIAREETQRVADALAGRGISVSWRVDMGIPWERILLLAPSADLVVMGTHGRTGLTRLLLGSMTDKVVQRSPTPVLTVRGAERVDAREPVSAPATAPRLVPV